MIDLHLKELNNLSSYMKYFIKNSVCGYRIKFTDRITRSNKDGRLICNSFLKNQVVDSDQNKLNYLANIYKDHLIIKGDKLIAI